VSNAANGGFGILSQLLIFAVGIGFLQPFLVGASDKTAVSAGALSRNSVATYVSAGDLLIDYPQGNGVSGTSTFAGLAVDRSGDLYAAVPSEGVVDVFAPNFSQGQVTLETLSDPSESPYNIAVCPDGTVYVANETVQGTTQSVSIYAAGATSPTGSISNASLFAGTVACDEAGNVYVTWWPPSGYSQVIERYGPGGEGGTLLPAILPTGVTIADFQVDHRGDIGVLTLSGQLEFFHQSSATPYHTLKGFNEPTALAFDARDSDLVWIAQTANPQTGAPAVIEVRKRSGKRVCCGQLGLTGASGVASGLL
jgi:hypothetical protein